MVRMRGAEHFHDACQRRLGPSAHIDRFSGQPHGVDTDQGSYLRMTTLIPPASATAVALARFSSMRM